MKDMIATILDDDELMLEAVGSILMDMGVGSIVTHTSGGAALATLDMGNPRQMLLCDLNMPDMDGIEVIRHLGLHGFAGGVIILSGEDTRTMQTVVNIGEAYNLRLLGALGKPVDRRMLLNMLQQEQAGNLKRRSARPPLSESEIRAGLAGEALVPYFQPQADAYTRKIVGVEALARWRHPEGGILGPDTFIHVAEESGLITTLTERMITLSLRQWKQWRDNGIDLSISVNLSMHSLDRITFPDWIVGEMQSIGMPLNRLILEITESQLSNDIKISSDVLARLCLKRIRLSVDDFGTAYSNMEKLEMLPFSELKIDRAFVSGAAANPPSHAILKSSAELGRRLGMKIVAEGVESREDWDCAAGLGCDLIQGYYLARPMPGEQLSGWMQNRECQ